MITHDQARALISARYDELLAPLETRSLGEHLTTCAACRQFAAETDVLVTGLRTLPQLAPSPRVSRQVREGIRAGGVSPWGWLGAIMRVATSPGLAVASSLALVAAFAFIIALALRPVSDEPQPLATISALADVIETPSPTPAATVTPTAAPTERVTAAPTQNPTVTPAPTATPAPTETPRTEPAPPTATTAPVAPTAEPAPTELFNGFQQATVSAPVETPVPTTAPPAPTSPPIEGREAATVTTEPQTLPDPAPQPTIAPSEASGPISSDQPVEEAPGNEAPAIPEPGVDEAAPDAGAADPSIAALGEAANEPVGANGVTIPTEGDPAAADQTIEVAADDSAVDADNQAGQENAPATDPPSTVAPDPAPTEVAIIVAGPPTGSSDMPVLPERNGNEALRLDGDSMAAEISATVQADLNTDDGLPELPETSNVPPPAPNGGPGIIDAEITGAPVEAPLGEAEPAPIAADVTTDPQAASSDAAEVGVAPVDEAVAIAPVEQAPVEQAPVEAPLPTEIPAAPVAVGAPEPGWPGIGGFGTQFLSNAGYSAVVDGAGVTVFGPDGAAIGAVGGGTPIWSPSGTSVLVIGPSGLGAVWDAGAGLIPVEPAPGAARDVPAGWLGNDPVVQRVYLDGSGVVELRVVPVTGAGGYALGTATTDSLFGEGVTAARLSPDGGQIAYYAGGQLYIAPAGDPASAAPAG